MKQIYKKENRILLSMITGMIVISLLCGIQWRGSQKNVLAWWGSIYPEFCFSEWDQYGCDVENFHQNRGQRYPSGLRKLLRGGKISICSEKFILLFRTYKTELENYI